MTTTSKRDLLAAVKVRYRKASWEEKTTIIDEFCANTSYCRQYAIRILHPRHRYRERKRTGQKQYRGTVLQIILKIWELLGYPCGTRLKPMLPELAGRLAACKEIPVLSPTVQAQLSAVSKNTLDRYLAKERILRRLGRGRSTTRHGSLLKSAIPIRLTNWDTGDIGFMEMDTVAHCGDVLSGTFVYSLDMVEIATGWSEQVAVMGKGEAGIVQAIAAIQKGLPFTLKGLDSDTGSEFVNWHMVKWCKQRGLYFTRSRPYYKNDNAYVEQKNYTHIRRWLGYGRYDTPEQLQTINDLYRGDLRLWNNFFLPVMKIKEKQKVNNALCRKKYDEAQTPYQRLLTAKQIPPETKTRLRELYESMNPVKLKRNIEETLKRLRQS